jgi:hypothetical protein
VARFAKRQITFVDGRVLRDEVTPATERATA